LRRTRRDGVQIGFYQSVRSQPTPFLTTGGFTRFLDTHKLLDVRYANLPPGTTRDQFAKKYELPKKDRYKIVGTLRLMEAKDAEGVLKLYEQQCVGSHKVYHHYSKEDISYILMPREGIV